MSYNNTTYTYSLPTSTALNTGTVVTGAVPSTYITATTQSNFAGSLNGNIYSTPVFSGSFAPPSNSPILTVNDSQGNRIVEIDHSGKVIWTNQSQAEEATRALSNCFSIAVERKVGINAEIKDNISDAVFEELISFAEEKGALTAEDLKFVQRSTKIVRKLRGI